MAVSNAIGSNVFDILVCLGLPWFIKTTMVSPGKDVIVHSKGQFKRKSWRVYISSRKKLACPKRVSLVCRVWQCCHLVRKSLYVWHFSNLMIILGTAGPTTPSTLTVSIMTVSIMTVSIMTVSIMIVSMTVSIMIGSITTLSIRAFSTAMNKTPHTA